MRVKQRRGRVSLVLQEGEVSLLLSLFDQLDQLLDEPPDADDEVLRRLFPSAHPGDEAADADFRELTTESLRSDRTDRIGLCRADLVAGAGNGDLAVDVTEPEASGRWIQALNDLRLALGTRLGISADDDHQVDPDDQPRLIYHWLTAVQDSVVTAVMG